MKTARLFGLPLALATLATGANALTLFSFESGLQGWQSQNNTNLTLAGGTVGATDGTQSLALTHTGDFAWMFVDSVALQNPLSQVDSFAFDLTITDQGLGGATWFQVFNCFNDAQGWRQSNDIALPLAPGTHTVNIDYSGLTNPNPNGTWFQWFIAFNGPAGPARTFYVDNIRVNVVPEPLTVATLSIGMIGLIARRRRK